MDKKNPAFTGYFNNGNKRIDLVVVIARGGSNLTKEMRINYLKDVIKFGLEVEFDEGTMFEHRNLIFIKIHAPNTIIEEYGLYFNVRKYFKDSHLEYMNPYWDPLSMKRERESIKLIREQYPGPGNYSTIERSRIVYNIINRLPFGQYQQLFGINRLIEQNIILDAFALHDGPYFLMSQQKICFNARQSLFYNWLGAVNVWRTQPVHMIHEYFGERVAIYFAYYELFNFMLLISAIYGLFVFATHYYGEREPTDGDEVFICFLKIETYQFICPQCRHFNLCPYRRMWTYCNEISFLKAIDTRHMNNFAIFVCVCGIVFSAWWNRKQNYLTWIWELHEKYNNNIISPKIHSHYKSRLSGVTLHKFNFAETFKYGFYVLLCAALFGVWLFCLFLLSIQIWYVKYWLMVTYDPDTRSEYFWISIGAGIYSTITTPLKAVTKMLSYKLTALENNETIGSYCCSLALKLYGFYFTGTFAMLTFHLFVDSIFFTHLLDMNNWYSIGGFRVMNNGLGTSLDDICITLIVAVVIEQIIIKIPFYFKRIPTDYEDVLSKNAPCWEREYKLDALKDEYFHNQYNNIAIQFAMSTLFSLTFPLAPLLILFINIWDIKHQARNLLLGYRRPLLVNTSGPAIWHNIIVFTSFLAPVGNVFIIALQSRRFAVIGVFLSQFQYVTLPVTKSSTFRLFKGPDPSPAGEIKKIAQKQSCGRPRYSYYSYHNKTFYQEYMPLEVTVYRYHYLLLYSCLSVLCILYIYLKFPTQSGDIEEAQKTEKRIKQKYYIKKGFYPN